VAGAFVLALEVEGVRPRSKGPRRQGSRHYVEQSKKQKAINDAWLRSMQKGDPA
jgi:hypothetical protein